MPKFKIDQVTDKKSWEEFVISQSPGTFLQSWNWGETNRLCGYNVERFGVFEGEKQIGAIQFIEQPAKRGLHYLVPGGPMLDYENSDLVDYVFEFVKSFARQKDAWFVRVRPDQKDTSDLQTSLAKVGCVGAPMHLHGEHTLILDVTKSEDAIMAGMRKNTRYAVRKSLKEDLRIKTSQQPGDAQILYSLQKETVQRHHFVGFKNRLFAAQLETFGADDQAELVICEDKGGRPQVAAIIIYYAGKAFYHHSGSSEVARSTNASYFTQWAIIKRAKKRGCQSYDFWGIAPSDNPKHRFAGVTTFKKGFGGVQTNWVHAHDLPVLPLYWATYLFETARRFLRHL